MMSPHTAQKKGRPLTFDHTTVIDDALAVFWQKGYSKTTISELEAETGLSRSSITNTFKSKHSLLLTCLDTYLDSFRSTLLSTLQDERVGGMSALNGFFDSLEQLLCQPDAGQGCLMLRTAYELATEKDSMIQVRVREYLADMHEGFGAALTRAQTEKKLTHIPTGAAQLLVSLAVSVSSILQSTGDLDLAKQTIKNTKSLIKSWR